MTSGLLTRREERLLVSIRAHERRANLNLTERGALDVWRMVRTGAIRRFPKGFFKDEDRRRWLVRALVRETRRRGRRYPWVEDFTSARLGALLARYYNTSPYGAYLDAGFADLRSRCFDAVLDVAPWSVLDRVPLRFWASKENRLRAVHWLLERRGKSPAHIEARDFARAGISPVLDHYGGSPVAALRAAGIDVRPWEMPTAPRSFWTRRRNRRDAVRWLVSRTGKPPREITYEDFVRKGLGGLIANYPGAYERMREAGYRLRRSDMARPRRGFWTEKENRVRATRRLISSLKKPVGEVSVKDFRRAGLGSLLRHYNDAIYAALREAGFAPLPWTLNRVPKGFWKSRTNRRRAVRWLVERCALPPDRIRDVDFTRHGLLSLLRLHYKGSARRAVRDAARASV